MTDSHLGADVERKLERLSHGVDDLIAELLAAREVVAAAKVVLGQWYDDLLEADRMSWSTLLAALAHYDEVKEVTPLD